MKVKLIDDFNWNEFNFIRSYSQMIGQKRCKGNDPATFVSFASIFSLCAQKKNDMVLIVLSFWYIPSLISDKFVITVKPLLDKNKFDLLRSAPYILFL